jgi:hypothetical protein
MRLNHDQKMRIYMELNQFTKLYLKEDDEHTSCLDAEIIKELTWKAYWRPYYNNDSYELAMEAIEIMLENYPKQTDEIMVHHANILLVGEN